jgi:hypothetical protein
MAMPYPSTLFIHWRLVAEQRHASTSDPMACHRNAPPKTPGKAIKRTMIWNRRSNRSVT